MPASVRSRARTLALLLVAGALAHAAVACGGDDESRSSSGDGTLGGLSGKVAIDGSSTVAPVTAAIAEEFSRQTSGVEVTVSTSGTGGGFEKFCNGEIDITNASRRIEDDEAAACASEGIEFLELEVALDAVTVVVNVENDWATCITTEQLAAMWGEDSDVDRWDQLDPSYPDEPLTLYGPDPDSGTFDYFTDVVNGEEGISRTDYTASADDNVLVQGVAGDEGALGYFGFAYFEENQDLLRALEVDGGAGCVAPSAATVLDGSYAPLSRPLFVYVSRKAIAQPQVEAFMRFYLDNAPTLVEEVQFVPQPPAKYAEDLARLEEFTST
jgi:phosphate transport system substrate-binding protein